LVQPLDGFSLFDDKGEVKRLVESVVQATNPQVAIDTLRKLDFSYIFTFSKLGKNIEVELIRAEIEASWDWRNGNIDPTLQKKVETALTEF
jgi:hypothetical protein